WTCRSRLPSVFAFSSLSSCSSRTLTFLFIFFFFNNPATTEIYTLSLHDALPISAREHMRRLAGGTHRRRLQGGAERQVHCAMVRSEEHTSELQSPCNLVCRLLLEKKKKLRAPPLPITRGRVRRPRQRAESAAPFR